MTDRNATPHGDAPDVKHELQLRWRPATDAKGKPVMQAQWDVVHPQATRAEAA